MRIIYPYNEILPKKKAHDVFIMHECAALAALGWDVTLLVGKGSSEKTLLTHYNLSPMKQLHIEPLFTLRKNTLLPLSWNLPFFMSCQSVIRTQKPDIVITSVRKQAAFHHLRKVAGVRYIYEAHELCYYPETPTHKGNLQLEKIMLSHSDHVIITTEALKEILLNPPYSLKQPIDVVPLAVQATALPPPPPTDPLVVMYIGQLYAGQGLPLLLSALKDAPHIHLNILGGTPQEIDHLSKLAQDLSISASVHFLGFVPPHRIRKIAESAHAFVAPFEKVGRMPYVAHTKLFEYAEWGRPIIAPNLPIVNEHFQEGKGVILFEPGNPASLASCMNALKQETVRQKLQKEISAYSGKFSWTNRAKIYHTLFAKS